MVDRDSFVAIHQPVAGVAVPVIDQKVQHGHPADRWGVPELGGDAYAPFGAGELGDSRHAWHQLDIRLGGRCRGRDRGTHAERGGHQTRQLLCGILVGFGMEFGRVSDGAAATQRLLADRLRAVVVLHAVDSTHDAHADPLLRPHPRCHTCLQPLDTRGVLGLAGDGQRLLGPVGRVGPHPVRQLPGLPLGHLDLDRPGRASGRPQGETDRVVSGGTCLHLDPAVVGSARTGGAFQDDRVLTGGQELRDLPRPVWREVHGAGAAV